MAEVIASRHLSGGGIFSKHCEAWLEEKLQCGAALLTPSCTAALEMAALLIDTQEGDEIIMPSFTFVSTANSFHMRGGVPVFVDIQADTYNINAALIEAAITPRTRAIVMMHYAGVACDIDAILALAHKYHLYVIEDNAHGLLGQYQGKPLGSFGHLAALSFHETKNITCGQGGALLVNDRALLERAYVLRDKGTNRGSFDKGKIPYYSWVDKGSNYVLSEIQAAFLWAQMEAADAITAQRQESWMRYYDAFVGHAAVQLQTVPEGCAHNAHIFSLVLPQRRDVLIAHLAHENIYAPFHYMPLHRSAAYERIRPGMVLPVTERISRDLLRLPLWTGVEVHQPTIIATITAFLDERAYCTLKV